MNIYHHYRPFKLESGVTLGELDIAYHVYGSSNAARDNTVWVCHALTADSDVARWWPHTVVPGGFLDPGRWHVVCANIIGSCYGTTGPLSRNPTTGTPYYASFPALTIRDLAKAHSLLADILGVRRIRCLIGASVGGFQASEWAVAEPWRFDKLALIATDAAASPWSIAINETQRMAIRADATYGQPRPNAGSAGLAAARALGLLTYRGPEGYDFTQRDSPADTVIQRRPHRAVTYQRHQGDKLIRRFNAYSYMSILDTFDTHDVGRGRSGRAAALQRLDTVDTMAVGISTDLVFPATGMRRLASSIPRACYREISSPLGHDGFLTEHGQLNDILVPFLEQTV